MKPSSSVITFLLLLGISYWAFFAEMPSYQPDSDLPENSFSTDRAMKHVLQISGQPHAVGFPAHAEVRQYLLESLEKLGLEPQIQSGYTTGDWGNLSKAVNILAKIPGSGNGKALVLLSHYDSNPHSSYGASDAASGVATILEGIRAYLSRGESPKNDIILLFTDAEELGLNGADLFVNAHPWIQEAGLILNFEARGSGGPAYMLIETNRGNSAMIEAFSEADPKYPVANSLAYSVYKMLPNDTDLTVFREDADIEGFNFAFIDDHFDYHTALDTPDRLDPKTLAHQGSYLMPLLDHFSRADLGGLKSLNEQVYFNVPLFGLISYPYNWVWPMMVVAGLLFMIILIYGLRKGRLHWKGVLTGFIPMLLCLAISGFAGYYAWPMLKMLYPAYKDMLHGFTYNGYLYIAAWSILSLGLCFLVYSRFRKIQLQDLLTGPAFFWLILSGVLSYYLPGAAFFLIPVFGLMLAWMILISQDSPNPYQLVLLSVPALWIFTPFVKMFPVGLGLKMLVICTLLCALLFLLLLPITGAYTNKRSFGTAGVFLFLLLFLGAHLKSGFSDNSPKPTSLLYVKNIDENTSYWASHEKVPSDWTLAYLGTNLKPYNPNQLHTLSSKYNSGFSYMNPAPSKQVEEPEIQILQDSVHGDQRMVSLLVVPQRDVNRLEVFTSGAPILKASVNGINLSEYFLKNRRKGKLITHFISGNDPTELRLQYPAGESLELTFYEASNDLLYNPQFSVPPRPKDNIPMPFVLNDAVLLIKSINFE